MLCTHIISATEAYPDQASKLKTLYGFYTTLMLGVIHHMTTVSEIQLDCLLPTVYYGLRSTAFDLIASSYMIIAQLTTKVI